MSLDRAATVAIIVAALSIVAANVWKTFAQPTERQSAPAAVPTHPELIDQSQWADLLATGVVIGDTAAPIVLVEFTDLECPFCARLNDALLRADAVYNDSLSYVFVHYPIASHRFARIAAHAAECAARSGNFPAFIDRLFAKQDSFGLKSWSAYALEAGIADTVSFGRCLLEQPPARIQQGYDLGRRMNVTATPTVFVNRWRLPTPPYSSLDSVIDNILAGNAPFDAPR